MDMRVMQYYSVAVSNDMANAQGCILALLQVLLNMVLLELQLRTTILVGVRT